MAWLSRNLTEVGIFFGLAPPLVGAHLARLIASEFLYSLACTLERPPNVYIINLFPFFLITSERADVIFVFECMHDATAFFSP